jgi:glycerol-3-phosphate dehydrogenase
MAIESIADRPDYDVLVIGGGVNGTGLARDLALRGLSVILVERHDLSFGASGNSSGMIHGGSRYMLTTPDVTRASCTDSGYIQQIAPHLIFRIPFLFPVYGNRALMGAYFELFEGFWRAYDDFQPLKRGKPHTRLTPDEAARLVPGVRTRRMVGAITFDEWGMNGARLCTVNALDVLEHGGKVLLHTTVEALRFERPDAPSGGRGAVIGARVRDRLTGVATELRARMTVNATGAWSGITGALADVAERVRVRPGKGIHVVLDRRITDVAIAASAIDGRQVFIEPWENTTVIGTTDDDEYGDLDTLEANSNEVRYLVEGIAHVFPRVRDARIIGTTAGARPTLFEYGRTEDALSREHELVDHEQHGVPGLVSLIGGKLASYRMFAQEAADLIAPRLGNRAPCTTHKSPLPGGERLPEASTLASRFGIARYAAQRLIDRHGARAEVILGRAEGDPRGLLTVCAGEPVLAAEVRYAVEVEGARTLDDVVRRTRIAVGPCGGADCALPAAIIAGRSLGWSPAEVRRAAADLLRTRARSRAPGVGALQARTEPLSAGVAAQITGRG